ncbi:MAG: 4Fe-4S dicluster domain-containing protein, partial [Nitrospirae bacterium]
MMRITIDGKQIALEEPITVLEAASREGIYIPTLCNHSLLKPDGNCRVCLVEVKNIPKLQTACTLNVFDGMVVETNTEEVVRARIGMLEFLLTNHPFHCPVCNRSGDCELQDLVNRYGVHSGRYREDKRRIENRCVDPIIARNMDRCIMCSRCVRMCHDVQGAYAIDIVGRGSESRIEAFSEERYDCEYCGNCIAVCPTASFLSRPELHTSQAWQITDEIDTVCSYCGVGCSMTLKMRDGDIISLYSKEDYGVNRGILCVRGRFGYDYVKSQKREHRPRIRKNGKLFRVSWDEAIEYVAEELGNIRDKYGGDSVGAVASVHSTNEANYLLQKFMRSVIGTNNIDSIARLSFAGAQRFLEGLLWDDVTTTPLDEIEKCDTIFVIGGDPTVISPILGIKVRSAYRNGANILTLYDIPGLRRFTTLSVKTPSVGEEAFLEHLSLYVYREKKSRGRIKPLDEWLLEREASLKEKKDLTTNSVSFYRLLELLLRSEHLAIIIGPDIIQRADGFRLLTPIAALIYLFGAKVYLMSEFPNEQGVVDVGCIPDGLPIHRGIDDVENRRNLEHLWDRAIPEKMGLTLMEMLEMAKRGELKALYVMGENPAFTLPNNHSVIEALRELDLLIVQDIFLTETAALSHVFLPSTSWAEEDGTYTNIEGRVQRLRKAKESRAMENWKIIREISNAMGYIMDYDKSEDVFKEMYPSMSMEDIGAGGFMQSYEIKKRIEKIPRPKKPQAGFIEGVIELRIKRELFQLGSYSGESNMLLSISSSPLLMVSSDVFKRYNLSDETEVEIGSALGTMRLNVKEDLSLPEDCVALSNSFRDK